MVDKTMINKINKIIFQIFLWIFTGEKKSIINGFESVVIDGKSDGVNARNGENALSRTNPAISFDVWRPLI